MGVKVKTIREWIKNLDDDDIIEFSCDCSKDWEVGFLTTADSDGNHSASFELRKPLDPNVTYIFRYC